MRLARCGMKCETRYIHGFTPFRVTRLLCFLHMGVGEAPFYNSKIVAIIICFSSICYQIPRVNRRARRRLVTITQGWTKSLRDSFSLVSFGQCVLDPTTCRGGCGAMAGMGMCAVAVDMRRGDTYAESPVTVCGTEPA
jgi:hypothetical protein